MNKALFLASTLASGMAFAAENVDGLWQMNFGKQNGQDIITTMVVDTAQKKSAMCPHDASTVVVSKLEQVGSKFASISPTFGDKYVLTVTGNTLERNGDKWTKVTPADVNKKCVAALQAKGFMLTS